MPDRPSRLQVLMMQAEAQALRGTCSRLQVGCVIHREGRILSTGYNGAPKGIDHCEHDPTLLEQDDVARCVAQHAERNAIDWAARHGIRLEYAEMVTTDTPCVQCAGSIINAGIISVVSRRPYRLPHGADLLRRAGVSMHLYADML